MLLNANNQKYGNIHQPTKQKKRSEIEEREEMEMNKIKNYGEINKYSVDSIIKSYVNIFFAKPSFSPLHTPHTGIPPHCVSSIKNDANLTIFHLTIYSFLFPFILLIFI